MLTKHTLFRPSKVETGASSTAKGIVEAETAARLVKTARLRKARAERDASEMAQKIGIARKKARKAVAAKAPVAG